MINEVERAEELLNGKPFSKDYFFTAYCILIKYYLSLELKPDEIRANILEWEEKFDHHRYFDLTDVIVKFHKDGIKAKGDFKVNISEDDILNIKSKFDNKNQRKIAFAMLCYAKANANKDGHFYMSYSDLGQWINMGKDHIHARYLKNIMLLGYVEKVESKKSTFTWNKEKNKNYYQKNKFKINVDYSNDFKGKWVLENNNILKLFDEIFTTDKKNKM